MNERTRAEEHLRAIRSLMERATIYRAISAPTALVGGVTAFATSSWLAWTATASADADRFSAGFSAREFTPAWLLALAIVLSANTFFIWREAQRDQRPFLSPGLRLALRSLLPVILVAAIVSLVVWRDPVQRTEDSFLLALSWIGFYGLALLSTMNFAPRSLSVLGWSFVVAALVWLLLLSSPGFRFADELHNNLGAVVPMGLTFGLFHLVYAACTWRRQAPPAESLAPE
ncbi:MAG: hypothetical protein ACR2ID_00495 [Chthoniobacterales bacterium]